MVSYNGGKPLTCLALPATAEAGEIAPLSTKSP
jgi:hypothetical protein